MPNVIKIDPFNFELYRFKLGAFFETQRAHILKDAWSFWWQRDFVLWKFLHYGTFLNPHYLLNAPLFMLLQTGESNIIKAIIN